VFVKNFFAVRSSERLYLFFSTIHLREYCPSYIYNYFHRERPHLASLLPSEAPLGLVVASFPIARVLVINSYSSKFCISSSWGFRCPAIYAGFTSSFGMEFWTFQKAFQDIQRNLSVPFMEFTDFGCFYTGIILLLSGFTHSPPLISFLILYITSILLLGARKDIWDRPDKDGRQGKRPTSLGQLLGKSKWEKPLADWTAATSVSLVSQERRDKEAERVERNGGWRREPFL
jgi:hypothetical protein